MLKLVINGIKGRYHLPKGAEAVDIGGGRKSLRVTNGERYVMIPIDAPLDTDPVSTNYLYKVDSSVLSIRAVNPNVYQGNTSELHTLDEVINIFKAKYFRKVSKQW